MDIFKYILEFLTQVAINVGFCQFKDCNLTNTSSKWYDYVKVSILVLAVVYGIYKVKKIKLRSN